MSLGPDAERLGLVGRCWRVRQGRRRNRTDRKRENASPQQLLPLP